MNPTGKAFYKLPNDVDAYQKVKGVKKRAEKEWINKADLKELGVQIYEEAECVICMANPANVILLPCGHKQFCKGCIQAQESAGGKSMFAAYNNRQKKCCVCRADYNKFLEVRGE